MIHHRNRNPGPRKGRVFRPILLALIIAAVCWGFWNNNQRRLDHLAVQGLLYDEVKALSTEQRARILEVIKSFKQDFGVPLEVNILKRPPALKSNDISKIYLDIVPDHGRAYLHMPPLVRNAVGPEFVRDMETAFRQDFAGGDWRANLFSAILALREKLAEVTR